MKELQKVSVRLVRDTEQDVTGKWTDVTFVTVMDQQGVIIDDKVLDYVPTEMYNNQLIQWLLGSLASVKLDVVEEFKA